MDWRRDLTTWPLNELSRRIISPPHQWHIQEAGTGDTVLLLHGAGASTHTWRNILPALARSHHVVAVDLPGQGFSRLGTRMRCGLNAMSNDIAALCYAQEWHPKMVIGHSAGGAIALDVVRHLSGNPVVVGVNAALENFDGLASWLFPVLARVLAVTPFAAQTLSAGGPNPHRAKRLLESTGSRLDDEGIGYYARLLADAGHVDGTLNMMAQWDIGPLIDRLEQITNPCLLLTGERDRAVNPRASIQACKKLARAEHRSLADLGHLAQEENPEAVLLDITRWIAATETVR